MIQTKIKKLNRYDLTIFKQALKIHLRLALKSSKFPVI